MLIWIYSNDFNCILCACMGRSGQKMSEAFAYIFASELTLNLIESYVELNVVCIVCEIT